MSTPNDTRTPTMVAVDAIDRCRELAADAARLRAERDAAHETVRLLTRDLAAWDRRYGAVVAENEALREALVAVAPFEVDGVPCFCDSVDVDGWPHDMTHDAECLQARAALATASEGEATDARVLYYARCGWCGAYEGTVDPSEPCAKDETGYIGPHQFGVYELATASDGEAAND